MSSTFAHAVERAWQAPPRWLLLLLPLEWLFAAVTALRRQAFSKGWLRSHHPGVPVMVVGNISVGGTGKTPAVIALAQALEKRELRVAVISRGYGGSETGPLLVQRGSQAELIGDEALLIARSIDSPVYIGADRPAVADLAAAEGAQVIISDDGLQHYALRRDIEIVTMDASSGFGNGHLLPVGPLRELPRRLATVDFLLQRDGQDQHSGLRYIPRVWRRLHGDEERSLSAPGFGPRVHALAGIARPNRFFETLRSLGLQPEEHPLQDHSAPSAALLDQLGDAPLVMTSKDEVKSPAMNHHDAWVLLMDLSFPDGFLDALLERLALVQARIQGHSEGQLKERAP